MDVFEPSQHRNAPWLIIVNSPYQALCALEAIDYFKIDNYHFVACISNDPRDEQLFCFFDSMKLFYDIYCFKNKNRWFELLKACCSRRKKEYNYSIICDCRNIWNKIISLNYLRKDSFVIFSDDGNNTMSFLQGKINNKRNIYSQLIKVIWQIVICWKRVYFSNIFFTQYNDVAISKYRCFPNTFNRLTSIVASFDNPQKVFIVGTNIEAFCKKLGLSNSEFTNYLSDLLVWINRLYYDEEIVYIPHGRDCLPIAKQLCEQHGIKFLPVAKTIELYMLDEKIYPKAVYGYTSTCLLNLKKLYPQSDVFNICCHQIYSNNYQNEYEAFSSYFEKHGIERINQSKISNVS